MNPGIEGKTGAGDAIIEAEDVHPPAVKQVMESGGVTGEGVIGGEASGRLQEVVPEFDAGEMGVQGAGVRLEFIDGGFQFQLTGEKTSGTGSVDDETGEDGEVFAEMIPAEDPAWFVAASG